MSLLQYELTRFYFRFSAGVGRSGAYIVIHSMVKQMHETGDINIFDFVAQIRQQRNHLVQEEVSASVMAGTGEVMPITVVLFAAFTVYWFVAGT